MLETQEMPVRSLGREDPLNKGIATHSSILGGRIPWTEAKVHEIPIDLDTIEQLTLTQLSA